MALTRLLIGIAVLLALLAVSGNQAWGAEIVLVTRLDDPVPAPACQPGDCSLRSAVLFANATPGGQTVELPAGTFNLNLTWSLDGWYEDQGQTADLDITDDVTILGMGMEATILTTDSSQAERALDVHGVNVEVSDLAIRDLPYTGNPFDCGRAIRSSTGHLSLEHVVLSGNSMRGSGGAICGGGTIVATNTVIVGNLAAFDGQGGGIMSSGELLLDHVLLAGNHADLMDGGAIRGNEVTITNSVLVANTTYAAVGTGRGGAVAANSLWMANVTLVDNRSGDTRGAEPPDGRGGAVFVWQDANLTNVTITRNVSGAEDGGGGIGAADGAQVTVTNSIIAGNTGGDCLGAITSGGHNIAGDSTCGFGADGDLSGTDPLLGPLLPVGATYAQALLLGSPAIDSADAAACPTADQRGVIRPQGSDCDRGAYEVIASGLGDVNCDGNVNAVDVLDLLAAIAEVRGADCLSAADVNGDHAVDPRDALAILLL